MRALRSPLLAGVLAILSLGGMLAAVVAPPSVSATGAARTRSVPRCTGCGWPVWTRRRPPTSAGSDLAPARRC